MRCATRCSPSSPSLADGSGCCHRRRPGRNRVRVAGTRTAPAVVDPGPRLPGAARDVPARVGSVVMLAQPPDRSHVCLARPARPLRAEAPLELPRPGPPPSAVGPGASWLRSRPQAAPPVFCSRSPSSLAGLAGDRAGRPLRVRRPPAVAAVAPARAGHRRPRPRSVRRRRARGADVAVVAGSVTVLARSSASASAPSRAGAAGWWTTFSCGSTEFVQVVPRFFLAVVAIALFGPGLDRLVLCWG